MTQPLNPALKPIPQEVISCLKTLNKFLLLRATICPHSISVAEVFLLSILRRGELGVSTTSELVQKVGKQFKNVIRLIDYVKSAFPVGLEKLEQ